MAAQIAFQGELQVYRRGAVAQPLQLARLERLVPAPRRLTALAHQKLAVADAVQPGTEACLATELVQPPPGLQKGVLGQVVGSGQIPVAQPRQPEPQARLVPTDQDVERVTVIAQQDPGHQGFVRNIGSRHPGVSASRPDGPGGIGFMRRARQASDPDASVRPATASRR